MPHLASSTNAWADRFASEAAQEAEVRRAYARKRSADEARERQLALSRVVQTEIIPRLRLLHPAVAPEKPKASLKPDTDLIAKFTDLVLAHDVSAVFDAFTALMSNGYSAEDLFLGLLAPSAALLGRMWDEDLCDFIEVTTGVARLQVLLSLFRVDNGIPGVDDNRRVLLMGAPSEQHTFGVAIVEQFMRKSGWQVSSGLASSPEQIAELVASEWFGVVGLTLSCETDIDHLKASIHSVRQASRNTSIGVMVGGPVFLEHPDLVERVGADASAVDAPTAVLLAQRLVDIQVNRR
jgi:MerR family transcriptional regulator, light-induced transcriptional regulator